MDVRFWIFFCSGHSGCPNAETDWYQMATKMPDAEKKKTDIVTWLVNCIINTVFA